MNFLFSLSGAIPLVPYPMKGSRTIWHSTVRGLIYVQLRWWIVPVRALFYQLAGTLSSLRYRCTLLDLDRNFMIHMFESLIGESLTQFELSKSKI